MLAAAQMKQLHQQGVWQQPGPYVYQHPVDYGALHYPGLQFPFVPAAHVPLITSPAVYAAAQPPSQGGRSGSHYATRGRGCRAGRSTDFGKRSL